MTTEINRAYLDHIRRWSRPSASFRTRAQAAGQLVLRLLLVPLTLLAGVGLLIGLHVAEIRRPAIARGSIHDEALTLVDSFVEQYPMHLYPIVAKALELAYVKRRLDSLLRQDSSIVEVAIGEGTLSARIFSESRQVTGLDLNPHSLAKAAKLPHVGRAIVSDGLRPPIHPGAFDLLLSLNFLHHITDKRTTVANWTSIARVSLFNENTSYWASGWTIPYVLRRLGLPRQANRRANQIERMSIQHLLDRDTLGREISAVARVREEASFFSERTFFLCGLFSFLMLCYGPPTPAVAKSLFLGALRPLALPLTSNLARRLLTFDARQDRTKDTFVFFECDGNIRQSSATGDLVCPRCGANLSGSTCSRCGADYPSADRMLFLLPPQMAYVFDDYSRHEAAPVPAEHL
ncbi:MAG: methyltransferase domain-containing protein [Chloroflexota bacterium]